MPHIQLIYSSHAAAGLSQEQVEGLHAQAKARNAASQITGILLYDGNHFIQVLEGEGSVLEALLERIKRDPRHEDVRVILQRRIEAREFPDWGMGFRNVQGAEPAVLERFSAFTDPGQASVFSRLEATASSPATFLLRAFLDIA